MGQRRLLGGARKLRKRIRIRLDAVVLIQLGQVGRDLLGLGKAGIPVLGHGFRDRHRLQGQPVERCAVKLAGRDDRLPPADEHPQAELVALGALDLLELAEPARHRERAAFDQHRIGGIGAGFPGALQKVSEQVGRRMVHKRSRCVRWPLMSLSI